MSERVRMWRYAPGVCPISNPWRRPDEMNPTDANIIEWAEFERVKPREWEVEHVRLYGQELLVILPFTSDYFKRQAIDYRPPGPTFRVRKVEP